MRGSLISREMKKRSKEKKKRKKKKKKKKNAPSLGSPRVSQDNKAQRTYNEAMLKAYKYQKPKDTRSDEERARFKEEAKRWSQVIMEAEKEETRHEQRRLDFMWEAIRALPEGPLRDAAMQQDVSPPPAVMRSLVLTDIGPIPDSEVERLDPYVIDHTPLQRIGDNAALLAQQRAEEEKKSKSNRRGGRKKK